MEAKRKVLTSNNKGMFVEIEEVVDQKHTAMLIIDMQNDYVMPSGYCDMLGSRLGWDVSSVKEIVPRIKKLLFAARKAHILIAHIQMTTLPNFLSDSPTSLRTQALLTRHLDKSKLDGLPTRCIENTWGWQIVEDLAPLSGEVIIKKHRYTAFMGTDLDLILRSNGIRSIVLTGMATNACVMSTANHGLFLEYSPVLVSDCIASASVQMHRAAFQVMSQYMDVIKSTKLKRTWTTQSKSIRATQSMADP